MTEKEKIQLQREVYASALVDMADFKLVDANRIARDKFPMPTKRIPRVVGMVLKGGDYVEYKFVPDVHGQGKFYYRVPTMDWQVLDCIYPEGFSTENLRRFADLMESPYIEVDDD